MRGREKNKQKTEIITLKLTPSLDFNENSQIGTITSNSVQGDKRRVQYCRYIILGQFDSQKNEVQRLKFIYSEGATKFCTISTAELTDTTNRQLYDGDFAKFCGLLRIYEL